MDSRRFPPRWRRFALGLAVLVSGALLAFLARGRKADAPPAVLFEVPAFVLEDERGAPFGSADLRGTPYVADFIYTGCTESCPMLTAHMGALQDWLQQAGIRTRLVSFSVDPDRDTPSKLLEYARRAHYDPARWTFVTGPYAPLQGLLNDGFKVAMYREVHDGGAVPAELIHDEHLVLVDARGRVRGYFAADAAGMASLRHALKYLATHPGA